MPPGTVFWLHGCCTATCCHSIQCHYHRCCLASLLAQTNYQTIGHNCGNSCMWTVFPDMSPALILQAPSCKQEQSHACTMWTTITMMVHWSIGKAMFGTMPPLQGALVKCIWVPLHQDMAYAGCFHMQVGPGWQEWELTKDFVQATSLLLVGLTAMQCLHLHLMTMATTQSLQSQQQSILILGASGGTALYLARACATRTGTTASTSSNNNNSWLSHYCHVFRMQCELLQKHGSNAHCWLQGSSGSEFSRRIVHICSKNHNNSQMGTSIKVMAQYWPLTKY